MLFIKKHKWHAIIGAISGFINGFCWGVVALCISGLGLVAQNYGIIRVLLVLTIFPVFASYFVKYLKEDLD